VLIAHAIALVTFVSCSSWENLRTSFKLREFLFSSFFFLTDASNTSRGITRCGLSVFAALCREPIRSSELKEIRKKKEEKKDNNNNIAVHGIEHGVLNLQ